MNRRLSASRLNDFLVCAHHAALWLDGVPAPATEDASLDLVRAKGFEHEARVLGALEQQYGPAVSIPTTGPMGGRVAATLTAIRNDAPLIYQAAFDNGRWVGLPDFLVRKASPAGGWVYVPEDAKLAHRAKADHVIQLGIYATLIEHAAGIAVSDGVIHVGKGVPQAFDLTRTKHVTARLVSRFEAFANQADRQTRAIRNSSCSQCPFSSRCEAEWRAADSPIFVANMRVDQMMNLEAQGIETLTALAACDPEKPVGEIAREAFSKLVRQASFQRRGLENGAPFAELLPVEPERGLTLMPPPAPGDLFFDMEGDPLYPEGLEYLFGLWGPLAPDGSDTFHPIWAHDRDEEKRAFCDLMTLFLDHRQRYPSAHIYHYAPYEISALKRLAMSHGVFEAEVDQMLRDHVFVDLYRVARQAIMASTEGYSLKNLEKIYWGKRAGEVTNAADSIVEYERWRELGDATILESIALYNRDDCISTGAMRDWLESMRPPGAIYGLSSRVDDPDRAADDTKSEERRAYARMRIALAASVRASSRATPEVRELIAEMLWFHDRADKPQWWVLFDRQTWADEDLVDDLESLGDLWLDPETPVFVDKQSLVATYRFDPQETKLRAGSMVKIARTLQRGGSISELDVSSGCVVLRRGIGAGAFPERCSLISAGPIDQNVLVGGVVGFAERFIAGGSSADQALLGLLERGHPRLRGRKLGDQILAPGTDLLEGSIDAVSRLDNSYLIVQGPPGTGKTYTVAHAIVLLLQAGKRIAVASNSHKAINNLLTEVERSAVEANFRFVGGKKATRDKPDQAFDGTCITTFLVAGKEPLGTSLLAGTAYHLARPDQLEAFDYLFVDEAGQVSLGNLVAMGGCARNIVLIGDQMQLAQPVQGVHPGQSGQSCFDYLAQGQSTVPPERGILLDVSWRMHSRVCAFVSDAFYCGRLNAHPTNDERYLILDGGADPALKPCGLAVLEVEHQGCTQVSVEEAKRISELVASLLTQQLRQKDGSQRPLTLEDILVVAPFNAQVNVLQRHLPDGARVGTVDRFQGQEAPVAIVSMAVSNGADAPRGSEFLFSPNRLNVAISRAQCLAVLVRGQDLLEMAPAGVEDLVRLEAFARADILNRDFPDYRPERGWCFS